MKGLHKTAQVIENCQYNQYWLDNTEHDFTTSLHRYVQGFLVFVSMASSVRECGGKDYCVGWVPSRPQSLYSIRTWASSSKPKMTDAAGRTSVMRLAPVPAYKAILSISPCVVKLGTFPENLNTASSCTTRNASATNVTY